MTQQALLVARKELNALADDDWVPSVQGAMSYVIRLRSLTNSLVMKLFTTHGSRSHSERERRALTLVGDYAGSRFLSWSLTARYRGRCRFRI